MRILTLENQSFELNKLPDNLEEDVRFAVLDNSDPKDPDFFWNPLIFLESFNSPAIVMEINGNEITMPLDWCIAVGCSEAGSDLEVLPLTSLNDRGFEAWMFNPLTGFKSDYGKIEIVNFYNDVKWYFPKMKNGQLLSMPLTDGDRPDCVFVAKDITRQSEVIEYASLI